MESSAGLSCNTSAATRAEALSRSADAAGILRPAPIGDVFQHLERPDEVAFFVEQRRHIA